MKSVALLYVACRLNRQKRDYSAASVKWSSSDNSVVSVSEDGIVTVHKAGKAVVTVTSANNSEIKDNCAVTVMQPVTGVTLSESAIVFTSLGSTMQLTATEIPDNASDKNVNWESSGILDIEIDKLTGNEQIYDAQGKKQNSIKKGLNIIRMGDGTTRKVVVK